MKDPKIIPINFIAFREAINKTMFYLSAWSNAEKIDLGDDLVIDIYRSPSEIRVWDNKIAYSLFSIYISPQDYGRSSFLDFLMKPIKGDYEDFFVFENKIIPTEHKNDYIFRRYANNNLELIINYDYRDIISAISYRLDSY